MHSAGTFHAIATRLLRLYAPSLGLDPSFTILDRPDAEDLLDVVRHQSGLSRQQKRFPRKGTCLAIYSRCVNSGDALQASILLALCPNGRGLTVVGDDAQSIYAFRSATVRNILDFPGHFEPPAQVITLEQNYRSTQPILDAANAVIGDARERYTKDLFGERTSSQRPRVVSVEDEADQAEYVVEQVLAAREAGMALQQQAVLFRTAHHSDLLQIELSRRNIPFVMYGGLRFLEAAHVKDLLCVLRWAENPRDGIAAFRTLQLFPGIGPAAAQKIFDKACGTSGSAGASTALESPAEAQEAAAARHGPSLAVIQPPAAARDHWPAFAKLMESLFHQGCVWPGQVGEARRWYEPHLERLYDAPGVRVGDLEQMELIAAQYPSRERFLTELTLDPPSASGDLAADPHLDEDFLILSTIHSVKGQEWKHVYVLNIVDGCIPSDMATGSVEEIEEERRLLYVAMTGAKDELHLIHPLRFYAIRHQRHGDRHIYAPLSRFLPGAIADCFEGVTHGRAGGGEVTAALGGGVRVDVAKQLRKMW